MAGKTCVAALALVAAADAFVAPMSMPVRTAQSTLVMNSEQPVSRAEFVKNALFGAAAVVGTAAVFPGEAMADGAVSLATKARARGIYGGRIQDLAGAVKSGDVGAVAAEKNAFTLFNSGAYATNKSRQAEANALSKDIFAAVDAGDAGAMQSAYAKYVKFIESDLETRFSEKDKSYAQGFGSEFDWKNRTPKGNVYQR